MFDTVTIKEQFDLRQVVERDLGQPPIRSGRASHYKCPFHKEQKGYSLAVWQDGYRCFGKCDISGDLFDWLMRYRHLTFPEALAVLGEGYTETHVCSSSNKPHVERTASEPPPHEWQSAAREVVDMAEDLLWSSEGECALTYLLDRGLTAQTIREARLGYIPGDFRGWCDIGGLNVPCGISIPWFASDALWAVKVRRSYRHPKYVQIPGGSTHGLYNADTLNQKTVALFCEGEFDALLVKQEAGDLVSAVTLGSATARLTARWYGALVRQRALLVTYDDDTAGRRGAEQLLKLSPRFRAVALLGGNDITDFYLNGGDLYAWVQGALQTQRTYLEMQP